MEGFIIFSNKYNLILFENIYAEIRRASIYYFNRIQNESDIYEKKFKNGNLETRSYKKYFRFKIFLFFFNTISILYGFKNNELKFHWQTKIIMI